MSADLVFLVDVDNTLLDMDRIIADLRLQLARTLGDPVAQRYWEILERLRAELDCSDYFGALQRCRRDAAALEPTGEQRLGLISGFLLDYPFGARLYDRVPELLAHLATLGTPVILSDGDVVFQPHKVRRSGLWDAVSGRVLIYTHKEQMLECVQRSYPARHYVMIDDKLRILTEMKRLMNARLTTVFVRQGHYANDPELREGCPAADVTIDHIGELLDLGALAAIQTRLLA